MLPRYDIDALPPIEGERHVMKALNGEGWVGYVKQLRALAFLGEAYRHRNEMECSYAWAGNSDSYRAGTERLGAHIVDYAHRAGLNIYLQSDCRGAAVYVRPMPHKIDDNAYSTQGQCCFYAPKQED